MEIVGELQNAASPMLLLKIGRIILSKFQWFLAIFPLH